MKKDKRYVKMILKDKNDFANIEVVSLPEAHGLKKYQQKRYNLLELFRVYI